mgnify:CR=1 FL=1
MAKKEDLDMNFSDEDIAKWESGELGMSAESVQVSTDSDALDKALGMQPISIRLEKKLIAHLKRIASHHNIGYQPMVRDLLNRFATAELKFILKQELAELNEQQRNSESTAPVEEFMKLRNQA